MDAEWAGSAPRYPAAKTLVVSLPGVEVGSVIEYKVKRVCKDRPFFAARVAFRGTGPGPLADAERHRPGRHLAGRPAALRGGAPGTVADARGRRAPRMVRDGPARRQAGDPAPAGVGVPADRLPLDGELENLRRRGRGQIEGGRLRPEGGAAAGEGADPGRRGRRGAADRHPQFRREADPLRRAGPGRAAAFGHHARRPDAPGKLRQQRRPRRAAPRHAAGRRLPAGVRPRLRRAGRRQPGAAARRRAEPVGLRRRARARAARRQGGVPERHRRVRRARRHRARRLLRARPGRREALHHPGPAR